jgi:hypothetical protein
MVLLLWTAADLTNSGLCALDSEDPLGVPASNEAALDQSVPNPVPFNAPAPHIDDCFCCSHCVDVQGLAPALVSIPVHREVPPLVLAAPSGFHAPLYHLSRSSRTLTRSVL